MKENIMDPELFAALFATTVVESFTPDDITDEGAETALEAARPLLEAEDDEPMLVVETPDGWLIGGGSHAILMADTGAVEVKDIPTDDEDNYEMDEADWSKNNMVVYVKAIADGKTPPKVPKYVPEGAAKKGYVEDGKITDAGKAFLKKYLGEDEDDDLGEGVGNDLWDKIVKKTHKDYRGSGRTWMTPVALGKKLGGASMYDFDKLNAKQMQTVKDYYESEDDDTEDADEELEERKALAGAAALNLKKLKAAINSGDKALAAALIKKIEANLSDKAVAMESEEEVTEAVRFIVSAAIEESMVSEDLSESVTDALFEYADSPVASTLPGMIEVGNQKLDCYGATIRLNAWDFLKDIPHYGVGEYVMQVAIRDAMSGPAGKALVQSVKTALAKSGKIEALDMSLKESEDGSNTLNESGDDPEEHTMDFDVIEAAIAPVIASLDLDDVREHIDAFTTAKADEDYDAAEKAVRAIAEAAGVDLDEAMFKRRSAADKKAAAKGAARRARGSYKMSAATRRKISKASKRFAKSAAGRKMHKALGKFSGKFRKLAASVEMDTTFPLVLEARNAEDFTLVLDLMDVPYDELPESFEDLDEQVTFEVPAWAASLLADVFVDENTDDLTDEDYERLGLTESDDENDDELDEKKKCKKKKPAEDDDEEMEEEEQDECSIKTGTTPPPKKPADEGPGTKGRKGKSASMGEDDEDDEDKVLTVENNEENAKALIYECEQAGIAGTAKVRVHEGRISLQAPGSVADTVAALLHRKGLQTRIHPTA